jgi:hypothetical protein
VTDPAGTLWELWGPPQDPPVPGGLPAAMVAQVAEAALAAGTCDHCIAAELWEAYAGMLPVAPAVASVSTGAQSVSYGAGFGADAAGLAMARAAWHRSFCTGELVSVPLAVPPPDGWAEEEPPLEWWRDP